MTDDDKKFFQEAMSGVKPLGDKHHRVRPHAAKPTTAQPRASQASSNSAPADELTALCPEQIISLNKANVYPKTFRRLKSGQLGYRETLDLHKCTTEQAYAKLNRFIVHCQNHKVKCALIIHGKGTGTIKAAVKRFLDNSPQVTAYHSAQPMDGGTGAVYVLLI